MRSHRHAAARVEAAEAAEGAEAAEEAQRAMRLGKLLSALSVHADDSQTRRLFVNPVITESGHTRERDDSDVTAVPHKTIKSLVAGYVEMYRSRTGAEWERVRELCDTYAADKRAVYGR